jgi:hypothetical protein
MFAQRRILRQLEERLIQPMHGSPSQVAILPGEATTTR